MPDRAANHAAGSGCGVDRERCVGVRLVRCRADVENGETCAAGEAVGVSGRVGLTCDNERADPGQNGFRQALRKLLCHMFHPLIATASEK
jgi:hypothetical protein